MLPAFACGGKSDTPRPQSEETSVTGVVRLVGSTPMVRVLIEEVEGPTGVLEATGELREELLRLSGARVRAVGVVEDGRIRVSDYEILEIAGQTPVVGRLEIEGEAPVLVRGDGSRIELREVPDSLLESVGAKVWVILDPEDRVQGYGVVRER